MSSGGDITVHVDISKALKGFKGVRAKSKRLTAAFREIRKPMKADQRDHKKSKEGPEGKWEPLAPSTLGRDRFARKVKSTKKGQTRTTRKGRKRSSNARMLGRIPSAFSVRASSKGIVATARVKYAAAHQEGGKVGRGSIIPARPFLWISRGLAQRAARIIEEHVAKGFTG